jgi:hypothetical protein
MNKMPQSEVTKIATISKDIEYIKRDIGEIKDVMKNIPGVYLTQKEHSEFVAAVNLRFSKVESRSTFLQWVVPIVTSVVSAGVTFLLISYLQNLK